jgi:hypothetical protein
MQKRRDFLKNVAGAAAGMRVGGRDLAGALQVGAPQGKRRELFIAGPSHKDGRRSRALLRAVRTEIRLAISGRVLGSLAASERCRRRVLSRGRQLAAVEQTLDCCTPQKTQAATDPAGSHGAGRRSAHEQRRSRLDVPMNRSQWASACGARCGRHNLVKVYSSRRVADAMAADVPTPG